MKTTAIMTTDTTIALTPDAISTLEAADLAGRLVVLGNRISPSAAELVRAGYLEERLGYGLVVTPAGKSALHTIRIARVSPEERARIEALVAEIVSR
jgi:hypothetical protein